MNDPQDADQLRRRLRIVRWLALLDFVLLVALVSASLVGHREIVRVLGPLHGINFLLLLAVAITATIDGMWGWWFPAAILLTAGPLGAFVGEWAIGRRRGVPESGTEADSRHIPPESDEQTATTKSQ